MSHIQIITTAAALAVAAITQASLARADILSDEVGALKLIICSTIEKYPSVAGVAGVVEGLVENGATPEQAGLAIGIAVREDCPFEEPVLQAFINTFAPRSSGASTQAGWVA
jgi:hypothetical protein